MNQLTRIKDAVIGYISPAIKRHRIIEPGSISEFSDEHSYSSAELGPRDELEKKYIIDLPYQRCLLLSQADNSRKRSREQFEEQLNSKSITSQDSESLNPQLIDEWESLDLFQTQPFKEDTGQGCREITSNVVSHLAGEKVAGIKSIELDYMVDVEAKVHEYLDQQVEFSRHQDDPIEKSFGEWKPEELFLYERLSLRSYEAMLPSSWEIDFPKLPSAVFVETDNNKTFVNTNFTSTSYGIRALQSLLSLGVRVRDNLLVGAPTKKLISREINRYVKWSQKDGGYAKMYHLPVLAIVSTKRTHSIDSISTASDGQLKLLAEAHRKDLTTSHVADNLYRRSPPLIYGIVIDQTSVTLVTLDSSKPDAILKLIQKFDFREKKNDVWIGLAIAVVVIMARNYVMSIKDELKFSVELEADYDI
ncbi:Bgt-5426 [Blumeria graminis f. sp. tritici]|uniref:Bgt-5426 n=2 Tax=Blumeria graminis f. sp. tritici TaxID=62690 RepID=A0A061HKP9_BLUGR|nr:hypothetical protein BGT96224_5426 [Blumeria graminis f. sp. tritici 96224]VCU39303.1 Bgt-5426 [Blumeria graminis f. sp. tritici]